MMISEKREEDIMCSILEFKQSKNFSQSVELGDKWIEQINLAAELQESLSHQKESSGDSKLEALEKITSLRTYAQHPHLAEN